MLKEQNDIKANLAIESAALGTYEINYATDEMVTSERFNEIWGIPQGLSRAEIAKRIHPDDAGIRATAHKQSLETGNLQYEARIVWTDGSVHWVRVRGKVLCDDDKKPVTLLGVVQDIHEQKLLSEQLEQLVKEKTVALQQSEQRYQRMIAEVEDYAILTLDKAGIVQTWNKGAEKIKGYKEEEIIGKSFKLFYLPEDREIGLPDTLIARATVEGKAVQEGWRLRKDGTKFWGSIVITALHDNDNNVIGFTKVTRDLTERKLAEDKLYKYNQELEFQNEELKQFAFMASHDMKTPLRKIIFYTNTLAESAADRLNGQEMQSLQKTMNAAGRMQLLIDDILSYSQVGYSEEGKEPVDLNVILNEVVGNLKDTIDETGTVIAELPVLPVIIGIKHQCRQLFDNLLNNAIKYRQPERALCIKLACERVKGQDFHNGVKGQPYYQIAVTDNGMGFSPDETERIFELFHRLKDGRGDSGTGIGLAICRKIVQNHNGFMDAEGAENVGACFNIYLPAAD